MAREVLLSVVIPTHNVAPWIRRTLQSVLRQGVDSLEVIVVDDHSSDGTRKIVEDIAARDRRLTLVHATAQGGGSARNEGARRARGEYLAFCDGDDLVPDHAYEALVGSLETTGSDMAVGDYLKFRAVHTWRPTDVMPAFDRPTLRTSVRAEPTLLYSRPCWNKVFRRSFWNEQRLYFPDAPRSNDIVPMVRAYLAASAIDIVPDVVYVYRERPGNASMTSRAASRDSLLSYLGQELECARLVAATGHEELRAAFADLVWERDGYVAVMSYLLGGPHETDSSIAATTIADALQRVLDATGPWSSAASPLRRLVVELTAAGRILAACAVARTLESNPGVEDLDGATIVHEWSALLDALQARGGVPEVVRSELLERFARRLAAPVPVEEEAAWRRLMQQGREFFGERAVMFAPDAWQPRRDATPHEERPVVDHVSGGSTLVVGGYVNTSANVMPQLFDGLRSAEVGRLVTVQPAIVEWESDAPHTRRWRAVYPARSLPLHRPLTPVVRVAGTVVSVVVRADPPGYDARDAFLYDRSDAVLVVRRRRHWTLRAVRRALHFAKLALPRIRSGSPRR